VYNYLKPITYIKKKIAIDQLKSQPKALFHGEGFRFEQDMGRQQEIDWRLLGFRISLGLIWMIIITTTKTKLPN
jgi:hypothetical protein